MNKDTGTTATVQGALLICRHHGEGDTRAPRGAGKLVGFTLILSLALSTVSPYFPVPIALRENL